MKQNTEAWHQWRLKGIGASDANVIMGVCPYKTKLQLAQEKLGLREPEKGNQITDLGHRFEPVVRAKFSIETDIDLASDVCSEHPEFSYLRASFDGHNEEQRVFAEIKMVGKKKLEEIKQTKQPLDNHVPQVQQQFLVSGFERGYYIAYTLNEQKTDVDDWTFIPIHPDREYIEKLFKEISDFWKLIEAQALPEPEPRDEYEFNDPDSDQLVTQYLYLKDILAKHQRSLTEVEDKLKAMASRHAKVRFRDVVVQTVVRKGSVSYKDIPQLKGINLEAFRAAPSTFKTISVRPKNRGAKNG